MKPGDQLHFKYRVVIHPGDAASAHVADLYKVRGAIFGKIGAGESACDTLRIQADHESFRYFLFGPNALSKRIGGDLGILLPRQHTPERRG